MKEGLDVLRMLFYANLLSSERDALEIIETERESDQKMEIELVKRRQRRNDNEEQDNDEHQGGGETTSVATARDQSSNSTTGIATTEKDKIESPYKNALQIKLGLKPNEYRHGQLPFDDFVNEYTNEKTEIKREYLDFLQQSTNSIQFSFIFYPFFLSTINKIGKFNINLNFLIYLICFI